MSIEKQASCHQRLKVGRINLAGEKKKAKTASSHLTNRVSAKSNNSEKKIKGKVCALFRLPLSNVGCNTYTPVFALLSAPSLTTIIVRTLATFVFAKKQKQKQKPHNRI